MNIDSQLVLLTDPPEMFPELPALAARLGIDPYDGKETGRVLLQMKDGTRYDLFAVLNAFLDRLDAASQRTAEP
jgi:hypothetical protein